jgi:type II secretory pathway pseudopilin PulG
MNRDFNKPSGISLFDWLFVAIVIAIAATISIPTLLSSRKTMHQKSAIAAVRAIHGAQSAYYTANGRKNYTGFDQLSAAGLLDKAFSGSAVVKNDYTIAQSVTANGDGYCARASPHSGETKYFGINQKGVLYQSDTAEEISCSEGLLTIGGGAVPQY